MLIPSLADVVRLVINARGYIAMFRFRDTASDWWRMYVQPSSQKASQLPPTYPALWFHRSAQVNNRSIKGQRLPKPVKK